MKGGLYLSSGSRFCDRSYTRITKPQTFFSLQIFIQSIAFEIFLVIPVAWYRANVNWLVTDIAISNIAHVFRLKKSGLGFDFYIKLYVYFIVYFIIYSKIGRFSETERQLSTIVCKLFRFCYILFWIPCQGKVGRYTVASMDIYR